MNETIDTAALDNRVFVLVLQHPRERGNALATAALLPALLRRARIAIGLSWPNLAQALGEPAEPAAWAVLHLGSVRPAALGCGPGTGSDPAQELIVLDRRGERVREGRAVLAGIDGIVLLDGTWQQAKTLWWRNPWLLKLRRIVLNPGERARYGRVRREPRPEALSTLEAAALALKHLEGRPDLERALRARLERLIGAASARGTGQGRAGKTRPSGTDGPGRRGR